MPETGPGPLCLRVKDYLCDCICKNDKDLITDARPSPLGPARGWHQTSH